jgi:hypothetical protein
MPHTKGFKDLMKNVKETYLDKSVPKKYQKDYGKKYDSNEIKKISYRIAKSRGVKIDVK